MKNESFHLSYAYTFERNKCSIFLLVILEISEESGLCPPYFPSFQLNLSSSF